jgi:hypothetical protein
MNAQPASGVRLKLAAALLAFAAGIGAVVIAVLLAHSTLGTAGSSSTAPQAAAAPSSSAPVAAEPSFPSPPAGALVLAREDRDLAVGLAVSRRAGRLALQASVIGQEQPTQGLSVSFRLGGGNAVTTRPCGAGCYRALVDAASAPRKVEVAIRGPNRPDSTVSFPLPASLPGPPAAALVRRAETAWRALETLVDRDRLSSGPGNTIHTIWRFVAPHRLTYRITNGPEAVVIGARRWDKLPGHAWQGSEQDPIRQPIPLWEAVSNAHLLGSGTVLGRPVWEVSFFDPQIPAWFTIWVDKATMRTLELRMTAQAHFMHEVYGPFNRPLRIVPPTKATA